MMPQRIDPTDVTHWFWPQRFRRLNWDLEPHLDLCMGLKPAGSVRTSRKYRADSYVPCGEWTSISPNTTAVVLGDPPIVPRCGIFQMPGFDQDQWLHISKLKQVQPALYHQISDRVMAAITSDVCDLFEGGSGLITHGLHQNDPHDLTTTIKDETEGIRVGLHIDSWEAGGFDERDRSLTRICINLGPGDRYFLYVPIPLRTVLLCLPDEMRKDCSENNLGSLVSEFFRNCLAVPVLRLLVRPGYGYFADTDNIIHDASTMGIALPNTMFTLRGRFGLMGSIEPRL